MNRTQSCSSRLHVVCLRNGTASGNCGSVRQPFPALSALMKLVFTTFCSCCCCVASVVSDSVRPHRRQPTRLPRCWDSPGKNIGVASHFLLQCMKMKSKSEVAQSSPTLSDPMDCGPPGSSIHGIFQARVLEWGAITQPGTCNKEINVLT